MVFCIKAYATKIIVSWEEKIKDILVARAARHKERIASVGTI
jgi:hypothetical protein